MISRPMAVTAILILFSSLLSACGGTATNSATSNRPARTGDSNSPQTNAEELGMLVKIPYETEDVVWKNYPESKRILAVLRFSSVNANKIVAEAGGTPEGRILQAETWFPEELIAQSEMSGDNAIKGIAYPATAFFQEPYTSGKIIRFEGSDFILLDLTAK